MERHFVHDQEDKGNNNGAEPSVKEHQGNNNGAGPSADELLKLLYERMTLQGILHQDEVEPAESQLQRHRSDAEANLPLDAGGVKAPLITRGKSALSIIVVLITMPLSLTCNAIAPSYLSALGGCTLIFYHDIRDKYTVLVRTIGFSAIAAGLVFTGICLFMGFKHRHSDPYWASMIKLRAMNQWFSK